MQQEINKRKALIAISWGLVVICMGVIFWLSSRTANESSEQSSYFVELLKKLFGDGFFTDFLVRKSAHCLEFTGLAFLFNIAFYITKNKPCPLLALFFTSLYAMTDEFHQLFVNGRSCEVFDWIVDSFGACLGVLAFIVIFSIIKRIKMGKSRKNN